MRRPSAVLTAALVLATLVGCGGDDVAAPAAPAAASAPVPAAAPATLSKAEFITQGDAVCSKLEADTAKVPAPTDQTVGFAAYINAVVALAEKAKTDFAALKAPADGQPVQKALLDALTAALSTAKAAATAAQSGDTVSAGDLLTQAAEEGNAADAAAQAYGFTSCGKPSSDSAAGGSADANGGQQLSKAEYIAQGDAICATLQRDLDAIPEAAGPEDFGTFIGAVVQTVTPALSDFQALEPPADGREVHAALLTALATSLETLVGAAKAADSGDTVTAGDLLTQAVEESSAADQAADAYGFQKCGSAS